jgi:serine/threonine-protein kinase
MSDAIETTKSQNPTPRVGDSQGSDVAEVVPIDEPSPKSPAQAAPIAPKTEVPRQAAASPAKSDSLTKSPAPKDARGLSAVDEENLERSAIRRGLATASEMQACKGLKGKNPGKGLLEIMLAAGVVTKTQANRLLREVGEVQTKLEIPGYQMIDRIGKGSMGVVFKAKQVSVDRIVAVKVLLDVLAQNREFISRFQREAKIAAKLSHNNIVNAIDAGTVGNHHYFVMEYVEGETIKDLLERGKVFEEKDALEIILKIADALKHAHEKGLIHRDIKPENIMLTKDGSAKLADLGLARPTSDEKWALAEAGMAIGTPYYISPEQVRGQVDIDIRADIYCLGATLYHMVTGRVPYPGETPNEVMKQHADLDIPLTPPDHLNTRLSGGLGEVIETMMAKDRESRYAKPEDLMLDLRCLIAGERPMIAQQKSEDLASLEESDDEGVEYRGGSVGEDEKAEMAAIVNMRTTVIAILAVLLGASVITNILLLIPR